MGKFAAVSMLLMALVVSSKAQNYYQISLTQNTTSLPIAGISTLFSGTMHPGFRLSYDSKLKEKKKNQLRNEVGIGFFYHRFFQKSIQIYDVVKYQYVFNARLSAFAGIGGGYMHSFYNYGIFKLNENGVYEKVAAWKGRPQYMMMLSLGANFGLLKLNPEKLRLNLAITPFLHGTFAKSYVPLVPYNSISLGVSFHIPAKSTSKSN